MEIVHRFDDVDYLEIEGVYPVMEDTLLLAKAVIPYLLNNTGRILDMGCGVGLITLLSNKNRWKTSSVDREPLALRNVRKNLEMNGFKSEIFLSDLFSGIPRSLIGSFDLITFNPPYLRSSDVQIDRRSDLALVGGKNGIEVAEGFLMGSPKFLRKKGKVILLGYEKWSNEIQFVNPDLIMEESNIIRKDIEGERFAIFIFTRR